MGLLKSRKDAGKEFAQYVDAVENPPELDDYVESEGLSDSDALPTSVSVQEIEAQLAARRAVLAAKQARAHGADLGAGVACLGRLAPAPQAPR